MTGRLQSELTIERRNDTKASEMPQFIRSWYMNMKASRKTAATCGDYLTKVKHYLCSIKPDVINVQLSDINEESVTNYYLSIQTKEKDGQTQFTSDSYQITVWCCLDNLLEYLFRTGRIQRNYIRDIEKPKNHDLDRINENRILLTDVDFKSILNAIEEEKDMDLRKRDKALVLLFMNTGMRRTAMSNVMISDIDFEDCTLTIIDKGSKTHRYDLNETVISAINNWLDVRNNILSRASKPDINDNHLFISELGKGMSGSTIAYTVKKYTDRALGHAISPHKLRSGYCSILYKNTGDIEFVRRAVGHANTATTQRYIVTKDEEKKRASRIMESLL